MYAIILANYVVKIKGIGLACVPFFVRNPKKIDGRFFTLPAKARMHTKNVSACFKMLLQFDVLFSDCEYVCVCVSAFDACDLIMVIAGDCQ